MAQGLVEQQIVVDIDLAAQSRPDSQEVSRRRDVVHSEDVPTCVDAVTDRRKGAGQALARPPAGQRAHEVLPGDRDQ